MDVQDVRYCRIALLSPWFPEVNPDHPRARTWNNWLSRQDVLLATATVSCLTVLVVNLIATALVQAKFKTAGIVLTLFEGSCSRVKTNDTIYHILINILSTLMLGASNLSMQLLAAPTRREVDKAHSEGKWLDIGVPSWRNLRSISRIRLLMWWCLALSSIPLHFVLVFGFDFDSGKLTVKNAIRNISITLFQPLANVFCFLDTTQPSRYRFLLMAMPGLLLARASFAEPCGAMPAVRSPSQ